MALGGSSQVKSATMLEQLLEEINFQRTKEMRQLLKDDSGFVVLQGTTYWTDLFVRHFLFQEEKTSDGDDLLFFVRKKHVKGSSRHTPKYESGVEVFRRESRKLPIGDPDVDWEETVYLNVIVHQFEYTVTLAVCTRTSPRQLQVVRRVAAQVYASPSRRKMDTKGEGEEMTYPHICFMVDNFDEVFSEICVRAGEMVCVELVARGRGADTCAVIFLGSIRYDALNRVYDARQSSLSTKVAQRMSFGLMGGSSGGRSARWEFVRMRGPGGRGHAEVCVWRPRAPGADTPCSEPGGYLSDTWDEDVDDNIEDLFMYKHQRRLSDPSATSAWLSGGGAAGAGRAGARCRSEEAGLDSLVAGIAEIDAGDLRDGRRRSGVSCCVSGRGEDMGEVYARSGGRDARSPACLLVPAPPATPADVGQDACAEDHCAAPLDDCPRVTVRGREELPPLLVVAPQSPSPAKSRETSKKKKHKPPSKMTPDGTTIYYWCDLKKSNELDDGAHNPVWRQRGFLQTYALWKEGRRLASTPLYAHLTCLTLPWWSIAKDILDHREEPILTF